MNISLCARRAAVASVLLLTIPAFSRGQISDYRDEALAVTEKVQEFVRSHFVLGTDLEKIHRIIDLLHDEFLFPRIDRTMMEQWIQDPKKAEAYRKQVDWLRAGLDQLLNLRFLWPLGQDQARRMEALEKALYFAEHDLRVFENVVRKKSIFPQDLPFAVSGAEAVEYGISDGCTTATKAFIVLAKAAGIREIRFVATGCTSDYDKACPVKGAARKPGVTISGHFFALVEIEDRWALVNGTYLNPYSSDPAGRYEIFYELDGISLSPEALKPMILKIPSFQREDLCQNRLYVIGIGRDGEDDMDIENYNALMNMSVCGDRNCAVCGRDSF